MFKQFPIIPETICRSSGHDWGALFRPLPVSIYGHANCCNCQGLVAMVAAAVGKVVICLALLTVREPWNINNFHCFASQLLVLAESHCCWTWAQYLIFIVDQLHTWNCFSQLEFIGCWAASRRDTCSALWWSECSVFWGSGRSWDLLVHQSNKPFHIMCFKVCGWERKEPERSKICMKVVL